jgi:hypothetical protein
MKLFNKQIDKKLFAQYKLGSDLSKQEAVVKIFNPYGRGTWYILNSDPDDPDYLWAIVKMQEVEVGSVSRSELENLRIGPYGWRLEKDSSFDPMNAMELFKGLREGKHYGNGGSVSLNAISNELYEQLDKITDWKIIKKQKHPSGREVYLTLSQSGSYYRVAPIAKGKVVNRTATYFLNKNAAEKSYNETINKYFAKGGKMPEWLFIGTYPNAYIYADNRKEDRGTYHEIGRITFSPLAMKISDKSSEYKKVVSMIEAEYNKLKGQKDVEVSATGQKAAIRSFEKGGAVDKFNYMMLDRLKSDCDYFLGYGNRDERSLWAGNVNDQIAEMKKLWNNLPKSKKPEWLTMEDILEYERKMKKNMAKGGKTREKDPPIIRSYVDDEGFEYGGGGMLGDNNYSIGGL